MNTSFSLFEIDYWWELESDLLDFTNRALEFLRELKHPPNENSINKSLYNIFRKLRFSENRKNISYGNLSMDRDPIYEGEKIDQEDDIKKNSKMGKRPDFQWRIYNDIATERKDSEIIFTIECKRLGEKINNRDLCKAYIKQGIMRFMKKDWAYSSGASSGLMIGYIQSSDEVTILTSINQYINQHYKKLLLKELVKNIKQIENKIYMYTQSLNRTEVKPEYFILKHLWVELKSNYSA